MPPTTDAVEGMEDSNAKEALQAEPEAAGAYDKIPFASASAIFTIDTSNDIFLLHSIQASPKHSSHKTLNIYIRTGNLPVLPCRNFECTNTVF